MKKKLFNIVLVLTILFFGCGGEKTNPDGTRIVKEYHKNKQLKSEITVKDSLRQGITKNYDEQGRLLSTVMYVDNMKQGPTINYYPKSGAVNQEMNYIKNELDGPAKMYYESGKVFMETNYKAGKKFGIEKMYYENGKPQAEVEYLNGYPGIGLKEYVEGDKLLETPSINVKQGKSVGNGYVELNISLSDKSTSVKFYNDTLIKKKFTYSYMREIPTKNGVGILEWRPGQKANIIAVKSTRRKNKMVIFKQYP